MWVISLGRNLHLQEKGVTRCLRLRRWNATMAITVISAHIHLLQASWFSRSFSHTVSPICEHTTSISLHPKTITTWTQSMDGLCLHTHAYTIFSLTLAIKQGESAWAWQQTNQHEESSSRLKRKYYQSYKNAPPAAHFFTDRGREYAQCCSRPELLVIRMGSEERQAVEWMQMNSLALAQGSTTSLFI